MGNCYRVQNSAVVLYILTTLLGSSLMFFAMSFTLALHIASKLTVLTEFTVIFTKEYQIGSKILEIPSNFTPCKSKAMAACFHAFYLLPQLNSDRSSRHNIFCRMERAKQSRCKRWRWSEKKTIYRNL